jgi:pimeloyl-ACP methyl ester carboxylesterase
MAQMQLAARPAAPWAGRRAGDDYGMAAKPDWREVDWAPHVRSMEIDGRRVNYADYGEPRGDARPVVLVHGLAACWQSWLEQIPRLAAEGRRVVALDLPGFGASEMPAQKISIEGFGRTVESLCDELDLGQVVLVGHSMGGFTAAEMAIQYPRRVERLVLQAAAGISSNDLKHEPLMAGARVVAAFGARAAASSRRVAARPRARWAALQAAIRYPSRIPADFAYELLSHAGTDGFLPAMEAIMAYDFRDRLPSVECPTLVVWGDKDALVPLSDADQYARSIPNARKVVFEDTGHSPMMERPESFNELLVEFLGEERAERPSEAELERSEDGTGARSGSDANGEAAAGGTANGGGGTAASGAAPAGDAA